MRIILLLVCCQFGLLFADVVTLDDGRQISGLIESGNTQELHIKVGDRSETVDIHQIQAIQFGASLAVTPEASSEPTPAQPNSLILKDGTHVPGKWWSIDATTVHFLENSQLRHYPRSDVSAVTFGNAPLPPLPAPSTRQPAPARPSAVAPLAQPSRGLSQPDEIGMVYSWNGKVVIPLERNKATEHNSGSSQYWEMPGPKSLVRIIEDSTLVFVVGLSRGVDPASYLLYVLETVNGSRRTRLQAGRRGGLLTWPVDIVKQDDSRVVTYVFTVRDLPAGEYSFSPSNSNDGYCFGVDASPPGK